MKTEVVYIEDENGDWSEMPIAKFVKFLIEKHEVEDLVVDDAVHDKKEVVEAIVEMVESGETEAKEGLEDYQELFEDAVELMTASKDQIESKKEADKEEKERKKKEREEEKERKEAEKKELAKKQNRLIASLKKGAAKSTTLLKRELEGLKKGLSSSGFEVSTNEHGGVSLDLADDITEDKLGAGIGFLVQREADSQFLQNTAGFLLGGACNHLIRIGMFPSRIQASKKICEAIEKETGQTKHPRLIESYARMDERIPLEYRNSQVVDKAYLEVANARKAKKNENEDKEAFKKRAEEYESDRLKIAEKISEGELKEVKEVKEAINDMQIKHGLKEKPDPAKKTVGDYLRIYFFASEYLKHLVGVHEEDKIVFQPKGSKDQLAYDASEIEEMREEALLNLFNTLVTFDKSGEEISLDDLVEGNKTMNLPVLKDGKETGKTKEVEVPVFPRPFFDIPKKEEEEEKGEDSGEEE